MGMLAGEGGKQGDGAQGTCGLSPVLEPRPLLGCCFKEPFSVRAVRASAEIQRRLAVAVRSDMSGAGSCLRLYVGPRALCPPSPGAQGTSVSTLGDTAGFPRGVCAAAQLPAGGGADVTGLREGGGPG